MQVLSSMSPVRITIIAVSFLYCIIFSVIYWSDPVGFWRTLQQMSRFPLFAFLITTYIFIAIAVVEFLRTVFLMAIGLMIKPRSLWESDLISFTHYRRTRIGKSLTERRRAEFAKGSYFRDKGRVFSGFGSNRLLKKAVCRLVKKISEARLRR